MSFTEFSKKDKALFVASQAVHFTSELVVPLTSMGISGYATMSKLAKLAEAGKVLTPKGQIFIGVKYGILAMLGGKLVSQVLVHGAERIEMEMDSYESPEDLEAKAEAEVKAADLAKMKLMLQVLADEMGLQPVTSKATPKKTASEKKEVLKE